MLDQFVCHMALEKFPQPRESLPADHDGMAVMRPRRLQNARAEALFGRWHKKLCFDVLCRDMGFTQAILGPCVISPAPSVPGRDSQPPEFKKLRGHGRGDMQQKDVEFSSAIDDLGHIVDRPIGRF
jgi:hypothetical protein